MEPGDLAQAFFWRCTNRGNNRRCRSSSTTRTCQPAAKAADLPEPMSKMSQVDAREPI
jgi:hypothetical protein